MELQKLITVLSKQEANLKKLLLTINNKKEALVNSNYEQLNKLITEEEQGLLLIQLTEEERLTITKNLFEQLGIKKEIYKLIYLIQAIEGKVQKNVVDEISGAEKRIKNTINEISRVNHLNMVLIQQSRSLISQTIEAIINTGNKSILDRKG